MIYYDWVEHFNKLKNGPRDENIVDFLKKQKIELEGNIEYRFIDHINDTIRTRLQKALLDTLNKMGTLHLDANLLNLEIINLKKELKFAQSLINLPVLKQENKDQFKTTLQKFADEINENLEKSVESFDNTGTILNMIRNSKINKLED